VPEPLGTRQGSKHQSEVQGVTQGILGNMCTFKGLHGVFALYLGGRKEEKINRCGARSSIRSRVEGIKGAWGKIKYRAGRTNADARNRKPRERGTYSGRADIEENPRVARERDYVPGAKLSWPR
jgi:hypothetical protein